MDAFAKFKKRMEVTGTSVRDEKRNDAMRLLDLEYDNDPSAIDTFSFWDKKDSTFSLRVFNRRYSAANGLTCQFISKLSNPIVVGDTLYESDEDGYWLCVESYKINKIHYSGKLAYCNGLIKWQNKYGEIFEYPCQDTNATQYNSGEASNKSITLGSSQHMITVMRDENTVIIESPQRFFLDKNLANPTPFVTTQNDSTSYNFGKGLCKIMVTQDVIREGDNKELYICDYIPPVTSSGNNNGNNNNSNNNNGNTGGNTGTVINYTSVISFKGNAVIRIGGNTKSFNANFYEDGVQVSTQPVWNVIVDNDIQNYITTTVVNDVLQIKALKYSELKGRSITIELSDNMQNHYTSTVVSFTSGM